MTGDTLGVSPSPRNSGHQVYCSFLSRGLKNPKSSRMTSWEGQLTRIRQVILHDGEKKTVFGRSPLLFELKGWVNILTPPSDFVYMNHFDPKVFMWKKPFETKWSQTFWMMWNREDSQARWHMFKSIFCQNGSKDFHILTISFSGCDFSCCFLPHLSG